MEPMLDVRVEGEPGSIPAHAFLEVLRISLDLLEQLERAERAPSKPRGSWLIADLRTASAVATLRRPDAPRLQTHLRLIDGVGQLRRRQELPPYFSPDIAEGLVRIGKQVLAATLSMHWSAAFGGDGSAGLGVAGCEVRWARATSRRRWVSWGRSAVGPRRRWCR